MGSRQREQAREAREAGGKEARGEAKRGAGARLPVFLSLSLSRLSGCGCSPPPDSQCDKERRRTGAATKVGNRNRAGHSKGISPAHEAGFPLAADLNAARAFLALLLSTSAVAVVHSHTTIRDPQSTVPCLRSSPAALLCSLICSVVRKLRRHSRTKASRTREHSCSRLASHEPRHQDERRSTFASRTATAHVRERERERRKRQSQGRSCSVSQCLLTLRRRMQRRRSSSLFLNLFSRLLFE